MPDTDEADDADKEGEKGEAGEASSVASANAQPCADGKDEACEDVEASEEVEDTESLTRRSHAVESSIQHSPFKKQKTNRRTCHTHTVVCLPPGFHDSGYSLVDAFSGITFVDCDAIIENVQANKATMLCALASPDLPFGEELRTQQGLQTYKAYAVTKK